MPFHTNSIAGYQFEDIRNSLIGASQTFEDLSRPGKDGTAVRLLGVKGRPHQIFTFHYVADFEAARDAINAYSELKDGSAYPIIRHSTEFGNFRILDVIEVSARAVANIVGQTIVDSPSVEQVCQWTVQHVSSS